MKMDIDLLNVRSFKGKKSEHDYIDWLLEKAESLDRDYYFERITATVREHWK